ncbi:hypothetical protein Tco_0769987, partial [Tanacetum coccineum]
MSTNHSPPSADRRSVHNLQLSANHLRAGCYDLFNQQPTTSGRRSLVTDPGCDVCDLFIPVMMQLSAVMERGKIIREH